jgi:hypothetical protein
MTGNEKRFADNPHSKPDIETPLSRSESDSIVDLLLSLPGSAVEGQDGLDRAVGNRLETVLAKKLRSLMEEDKDRPDDEDRDAA